MKRSKLTERCALGHPKCSHTYGGKCYSVDLYVGPQRLPTPNAAHLFQDPGNIADDDPIRVKARCNKCKKQGFRIRSMYSMQTGLPPLYVVTGSVVHTHVHKFDSGLRRWIIIEEPLS